MELIKRKLRYIVGFFFLFLARVWRVQSLVRVTLVEPAFILCFFDICLFISNGGALDSKQQITNRGLGLGFGFRFHFFCLFFLGGEKLERCVG